MKLTKTLKVLPIILLFNSMIYANSLNLNLDKSKTNNNNNNNTTNEQITVAPKENITIQKQNIDENLNEAIKVESFVEKKVIDGYTDLGTSKDDVTTINYMEGHIDDKDILSVKKKKEDLSKAINTPLEDVKLKSETIYYVPEKGLEATIFLKMGYSTEIEFLDELGNPINISNMSIGSKIFDALNSSPNIITMLPTSKYKDTNFNVRLDGVPDPVILRLKEGVNNISHTRVKIIIVGNRGGEEKDELNLKTNILSELLKYGTLHGDTQLDYEVVDIARKETSYFEKKYLKIFKVNKHGKDFTIILLDNMYEILGQNGDNFNRYQNSFNVYFLPDNREVFTIMTKLNKKSKPTSLDFQKDSGLIEKYRIIIKE